MQMRDSRATVPFATDNGTIQHLGTLTRMLELIYAADAMLLRSRAEAMPATVLEAMPPKTPIVAWNVDGIPELIDDGITGFLFPRENTELMVQKLAGVAGERHYAAGMVEAGYQRYSPDVSQARLRERYAELLRGYEQRIGNAGPCVPQAKSAISGPGSVTRRRY